MKNLLNRETGIMVIVGLLLFSVLTSKGIIIYNEEILVALSFFGFVIFTYQTFGKEIEESLNARSEEAKEGLQNFISLKEDFIKKSIEEYKKQLSFNVVMSKLKDLSLIEMTNIGKEREKVLQILKPQLVLPKLNNLSISQAIGLQKLQSLVAISFLGAVLEKFRSSKSKQKPKLIRQAIQHLKSK
uniref:ATP synthase protein MI25 n=1 Tax=Chlorokybus atmophyticus TaxID=3144 RepID=A6YE81_CHLAT|nr:ATP synthase F0 subunit beta [Chlorokybus atmophyticus]ABO15091.1 ATP synthase F0 subunit beta [Chlorokybus atmophyticus]